MPNFLDEVLAYIATPAGFILFVAVMTLAYGSIWFLFLYEEKLPVKKKQAKAGGEEAEEEARAREKQPAPSR